MSTSRVVRTSSVRPVTASERSRTVDLAVGEPTLAPGAAEVLAVVCRAYAVVDDVDGVVRANPSAYALGLVRGHCDEWGYFLLSELTAVRNRLGLPMERDLYFLPRTVREVLERD